MTAHEMVKKLDDRCLDWAAKICAELKRKDNEQRALEVLREAYYDIFYMSNGMLCEIANREEAK